MMGRPKIRGHTRRLTVDLDDDLFNRMLEEANRQHKSIRELIEHVLADYLKGKRA